jgi:hypothetical protein
MVPSELALTVEAWEPLVDGLPSTFLQEPIDDVERWQKKDQPKDYESDI